MTFYNHRTAAQARARELEMEQKAAQLTQFANEHRVGLAMEKMEDAAEFRRARATRREAEKEFAAEGTLLDARETLAALQR